jgi:hypothetical protein
MMLWLIYVSYLVLRGTSPSRQAGEVLAARHRRVPRRRSLTSVRWWRSEHPGSVFEGGGVPTEMLIPLFVGLAVFTLMYGYLMSVRLRVTRLRTQLEEEVAE